MSRTIKFVSEAGGSSDQEIMLRDTDTELLIHCAFDKHGYCRKTCAALSVEGQANEIVCQRFGGKIGHWSLG